MFIWSCGGLAPFLMRMICCEDGRSQDAEAKPAPFNSLTAANGITLKAGESLLFKAGTTCTSATQTIDGASVKTGLRVINAKGAKDAPHHHRSVPAKAPRPSSPVRAQRDHPAEELRIHHSAGLRSHQH